MIRLSVKGDIFMQIFQKSFAGELFLNALICRGITKLANAQTI